MDKLMTKVEIEERIKKLEQEEFDIQMIDHWTGEDYVLCRKIQTEIKELKNQLKEME